MPDLVSKKGFAKGACHTCRRRRVKCDRRTPRCEKCQVAGVECLGYGKLILWVEGIASRGKMMGKSFDFPQKSINYDSHINPSTHPTTTTATVYHAAGMGAPPLRMSLLDPLLQDWSASARQYLAHFFSRVCGDILVYDTPTRPWNLSCELYRRSQACPALMHIIIAMSAYHLFNLVAEKDRALGFLVDALRWKQRALTLLHDDLGNFVPIDLVGVLSCSILFVDFELLESGENTWRVHLNSAIQLMSSIGHPILSAASHIDENNEDTFFDQWVLSSIVMQDIFGASLSGRGSTSITHALINSGPETVDLIEFAEVHHFISCPADLVRLVATASNARNLPLDNESTMKQLRQNLLQSVQQFDPFKWSMGIQSRLPVPDHTERYHLGCAYKAAVALYITRVLPNECFTTLPGQEEEEEQVEWVEKIIYHLSQIQDSSTLLKATIWSSYVAGAETTDPSSREWVTAHLDRISRLIPWKTTISATDVLREIWRRLDAPPNEGSRARRNWVHEFQQLDVCIFPA